MPSFVRSLKPTHSDPPLLTDWEWINMSYVESMGRHSKVISGSSFSYTIVRMASGKEIHCVDSPEMLWSLAKEEESDVQQD